MRGNIRWASRGGEGTFEEDIKSQDGRRQCDRKHEESADNERRRMLLRSNDKIG